MRREQPDLHEELFHGWSRVYARDGELRILPTEKLREQLKKIGRSVVADHPEALRILAEHDGALDRRAPGEYIGRRPATPGQVWHS